MGRHTERLVVLASDIWPRSGFAETDHPEEESRMRWCCVLVCAAARAFAASLLERRGPGGADGETPSVHHVMNDGRFASLDFAA